MHEYSEWYRGYYARNVDDETRPFACDPAGPRVVLVPGVGIITAGPERKRTQFARDLYHRAIAVEDAADALGGFRSLSEAEAFKIEYWPLERYKLAQAPKPRELSGRIALITGGGSGIGRATARLMAELGAHVVVADLNFEGAGGGRRRAGRDLRRRARDRRCRSTSPARTRSSRWCVGRCWSTAGWTFWSPQPGWLRVRP